MKENKRLNFIIAFLIFGLIQIFNSNAIISFAGENISTPEVEDGTYIIKSVVDQDYVIDVDAGSKNDGANIQLYKRNDSNAQKWIIKKVDNKYYTITSLGSNKVLDVYARTKNTRN